MHSDTPRGPGPADVPALLRLLQGDPGRPRLTWYGPAGERIELSGHVLDNWVAKTANLLLEEYDAAPGTRVLLDLPPHWRTLVWALAAWRVGATVVLPGTGEARTVGPAEAAGVDVVVTDRPGAYAEAGAEVVAVALPALARRFDGDLPPGATDAAAAVMTYGDALGWVPPTDPEQPALEAAGVLVRHRELLGWPTPAPDGDQPRRWHASAAPLAALGDALAAWRADGSLVLCAPEVGVELAGDPERLARLLATERVTG